jgi:hypothetical protein
MPILPLADRRLTHANAKLIQDHFGADVLRRLLRHDSLPLGLTAIPGRGPRRWADARVGYVMLVGGVATVLTWDQVTWLADTGLVNDDLVPVPA